MLLRYRVTTNGDLNSLVLLLMVTWCYYATVLLLMVLRNGDLVLLRYRVTTLPCYY